MKTKIAIILFWLASFAFPVFALMSSSNYRIERDSLNVGGTDEKSASYQIQETIGEMGTGEASSATYKVQGGYQQAVSMAATSISISEEDDVSMSPSISGITGGTGNGSAEWTVTTDSSAGYTLSIKASSTPAMVCSSGGCNVGSDSFANYTPAGANPDWAWSVNAANSEFGFTPEGSDIVAKFQDDQDGTCGTGGYDTADQCWYNFSTADEDIASSASANSPSGTATTVKMRAESGNSHFQMEGDYQATITVTAVVN